MDVYDEFTEKVVCKICNRTEGLEKDEIHETNDVRAHLFCLLFSSGLGQKGKEEEGIKGFLAADIRKEMKRGARLKCVYCRKKGATVGCAEQKCKKSFHLPCGYQHDSLQQYFDQFKSFCREHRPVQRVPRTGGKKTDKKDNICSICQERITRKATIKTLWSPCCQEFYHRACIQELAHSCGSYHFRCPLCQNDTEFTAEMKRLGIYIPVQDPKWENNQQFQDIDEPPVVLCHAKICFCPQEGGRAYNKEHSLWEVLPCRSCRSRGIHAKCGGLEDYPEAFWDCYNCKNVMKDDQPKLTVHTDKLWTPKHQDQAEPPSSPDSVGSTSEQKRPSTNRLFEALLATLPHLHSIEDSVQNEDSTVNKFELSIVTTTAKAPSTITSSSALGVPLQTGPQCQPGPLSDRLGSSAIVSVTSRPLPIVVSATTNTASVTGTISATTIIQPPTSDSLTVQSSAHINNVQAVGIRDGRLSGSLIAPLPKTQSALASLPPAGSDITASSTTVQQLTLRIPEPGPSRGGHAKLDQQSRCATSQPGRQLSIASGRTASSIKNTVTVVAPHRPTGKNQTTRSEGALVSDNTGAKMADHLTSVTRPADKCPTVTGKVVTKNIVTKFSTPDVKELYDYTLEDIIRSRLKESPSGDANEEHDLDGLTVKLGGPGLTKSVACSSASGNVWKKTSPVFRLVSSADHIHTGSQRKMTEYFLNRKH